ncbi:MAG: tetratricopeptide repeat protein [Candidatus Omnitrophota bacterium]|nr:tetratricopeptide repeat protein [Candidatus Omnitrophota bacterium]
MKKIILILISILVAIFVILSVFGMGGEYEAEKLFYRAMKVNSKITINPDVAPPALLLVVENNLNKLITKYPKANITKTANIALLEFYIAHKNYNKGMSLAGSMIQTYKEDLFILSVAQFLKGVIYEKQNDWSRALTEFITLRDKYPNTQLGVQIPLYIAKYYDTKGEDSKAMEAYGQAQSFYENMEKEYEGKNMGYIASAMLIQTFVSSRNYEKAGASIEYAIDKYYSQMALVQLLPLVENIIVTKLKNSEKAVDIYNNILAKSKDEKLKKVLQKRIDELTGKGPVSVSKS